MSDFKDKLKIDLSDLTDPKKNQNTARQMLGDGKREDYRLNINIASDKTEGYSWGLLADFLSAYDAGNTDTNSLRWAFLSTVATMKGRDCWVNFGGQPLYPNMYTLITGDPGCGKSTAINAAKSLLDELGYPSRTPDIIDAGKLGYYFTREYKEQRIEAMPLEDDATVTQSSAKQAFLNKFDTAANTLAAMEISDRFTGRQFNTRERLEELDHDALAIVAGEYTGTFPPNAKWFTSKALIDLYDAPDHNRYEINEGTILQRPIINLLGGVTPSGLTKTFEASDLHTGLLTRIMLVFSTQVEKSDPFAQRHDFKASTDLLNSLRTLYDYKGEIGITEEARKVYNLISVMQMNSTYDIRLEFYYNRRSLHLTKVAMLIALLNSRAEITKSDMITANTLMLFTEFNMPRCLSAFANTAQIKIRNEIIDYLEKHMAGKAGITSEDIVVNVSGKLGINQDSQVVRQLQRLHDSGMIMVMDNVKGANHYILNKPKNTDVIEATALKVADINAIPEWDFTSYANVDEDIDVLSSPEIEL